MSEAIRLSKRLAELLPCSRREAELYIEGGWVTVDGQVIEEPQYKVDSQAVALLPGARPEAQPPATLLLHKPAGVSAEQACELLGAASRSADDPSGLRLLQRHLRRLDIPLPLEAEACGLLVLSQNRGVIRKLSEDAAKIEQEYIVELAETPSDEQLARLEAAARQAAPALGYCKISRQSENRLRFALKAAQPGQVGKLCRAAGLQVTVMRRIRIGRLAMAKLPAAQWRYLGPNERF